MSLTGHAPWPKNPKYCSGCFRTLREKHGGAEIECSLLFADVRGSTSMAETMTPFQFRSLMGRYYDGASEVLFRHNAIVDKFVGDEVIAIFVPAFAGARHAAVAVEAARDLMRATGQGSSSGPWVPIGIGIDTGIAFVGSVGEGMDAELTAMGDVVNVTSRLASEASAGEILVERRSAEAAGLPTTRMEARVLELKGKSNPTEVIVVPALE
jgi:adenylate cyclase